MDQNQQRTQTEQKASTQQTEPVRIVQQPAPVDTRGKAFTITGMVLGIASIVLFLVLGLGLILGIAGLVLGIISMRKKFYNRGMAIAAIITGALGTMLGLVLGVVFTVILILGQNAANNAYKHDSNAGSTYNFQDALQKSRKETQDKKREFLKAYNKLTPGSTTKAQSEAILDKKGNMSERKYTDKQEYDLIRGYTVDIETYYLYFKGDTLVKKQTPSEYSAEQVQRLKSQTGK